MMDKSNKIIRYVKPLSGRNSLSQCVCYTPLFEWVEHYDGVFYMNRLLQRLYVFYFNINDLLTSAILMWKDEYYNCMLITKNVPDRYNMWYVWYVVRWFEGTYVVCCCASWGEMSWQHIVFVCLLGEMFCRNIYVVFVCWESEGGGGNTWCGRLAKRGWGGVETLLSSGG